jgi:hypothetical protein
MPDYGQPINFYRTSARCVFQASQANSVPTFGAVPGVDFGDIVKVTGDLGPDEVEVYTSQNGFQTLVRMDVAKLKPVFTISCHEFVQDNVPLLFAGTSAGTVSQAIATAATFTITAPAVGSAWDIGYGDITVTTVMGGTGGSTALVRGVDYDIDLKMGLIRFIDSSTVVDGTHNVIVTYSAPAVTLKGTTGLNAPNTLGWMTMWVTDGNSSFYRMKLVFQTILSSKKFPDFDVSKFTEIDMTAAVLGNLTIVQNTGITL